MSPILQSAWIPSACQKADRPERPFGILRLAWRERRSRLPGKRSAAREDAASGDRGQIVDISSDDKPGPYVLETDVGKSTPIEIGDEVHRYGLWLSMRGSWPRLGQDYSREDRTHILPICRDA